MTTDGGLGEPNVAESGCCDVQYNVTGVSSLLRVDYSRPKSQSFPKDRNDDKRMKNVTVCCSSVSSLLLDPSEKDRQGQALSSRSSLSRKAGERRHKTEGLVARVHF